MDTTRPSASFVTQFVTSHRPVRTTHLRLTGYGSTRTLVERNQVMVNKLNVELTVGKKLKPMDQHGVLLGDEYIRRTRPPGQSAMRSMMSWLGRDGVLEGDT